MKQFKYCFILPPFLSNFAEFDAENWLFWRILGCFWPYFARLKPVFRIKFSKIWESQNWNRKSIELPHVSTERLCAWQNLNPYGSPLRKVFSHLATAWSQWFQTNLINGCFRMNKNCRKNLKLAVCGHWQQYNISRKIIWPHCICLPQ